MDVRNDTGLIKEHQDHTPVQETAATVDPAATALTSFPVVEVLPMGKENAISAPNLCDYLGFDTVRELQREIARERAAGAVILSTCRDGGGYFLPENEGEVRQFVQTLENRARNTFLALRSARGFLSGNRKGVAEDEQSTD